MTDTSSMPLIGDKFPEVEVKTTHGTIKLPAYYKGKWFVLFSHPADFTPVCTTEFVAFAKKAEAFKELGAELIGLSIDQVFSHIKWVEWIKDNLNVDIPFPIIADHGDMAKTMGMVHPGKASNTVRAVFIVDDKGTIRLIIYYPQEVGRSVDEVLRALKALKTSDEKGVSMPENWPNSEMLGNKVIIPPAATVDEAYKRKGGPGYDWWFNTKDL
ncbi:MAG: peroxiredoxin [Candidatus Methanomethylophilaceae archaeon]|nr:peroxiredoxin [Candidatus Methanomethylophilaceae archaeon]